MSKSSHFSMRHYALSIYPEFHDGLRSFILFLSDHNIHFLTKLALILVNDLNKAIEQIETR